QPVAGRKSPDQIPYRISGGVRLPESPAEDEEARFGPKGRGAGGGKERRRRAQIEEEIPSPPTSASSHRRHLLTPPGIPPRVDVRFPPGAAPDTPRTS